jgi:hypothetical protein
MIDIIHFGTLAVATVFAGGTAVLFHWVLLCSALRLMRPVTARRAPVRSELVRGTEQLTRAFATQR